MTAPLRSRHLRGITHLPPTYSPATMFAGVVRYEVRPADAVVMDAAGTVFGTMDAQTRVRRCCRCLRPYATAEDFLAHVKYDDCPRVSGARAS